MRAIFRVEATERQTYAIVYERGSSIFVRRWQSATHEVADRRPFEEHEFKDTTAFVKWLLSEKWVGSVHPLLHGVCDFLGHEPLADALVDCASCVTPMGLRKWVLA